MGHHVLVVDDEDDIRDWLKLNLSLEGWQVDEARSGEDALRYCAAATPDLIILDQRMPGKTGLQTARALRRIGSEARIILFSAFMSPEMARQAKRVRATAISKVDHPALFRLLHVMDLEITAADHSAHVTRSPD
jgi:two-component system, response regulator, stage 0 sporulation protein F